MIKVYNCFCGFFGLLFCVYFGSETGRVILLDSGNLKMLYNPFIAFIWITGIPFFTALVLGWRICSDIGSDQAFTVKNAD